MSKVLENFSNPRKKERWIGDSGATVHITNNHFGMFNVKCCNFGITVGNKENTRCSKMGDILLKLKDSTGKKKIVILYNVRYVPCFVGNLFCISTAMTNGAGIRLKDKKWKFKKEV